jgi:hypothetical protein
MPVKAQIFWCGTEKKDYRNFLFAGRYTSRVRNACRGYGGRRAPPIVRALCDVSANHLYDLDSFMCKTLDAYKFPSMLA